MFGLSKLTLLLERRKCQMSPLFALNTKESTSPVVFRVQLVPAKTSPEAMGTPCFGSVGQFATPRALARGTSSAAKNKTTRGSTKLRVSFIVSSLLTGELFLDRGWRAGAPRHL